MLTLNRRVRVRSFGIDVAFGLAGGVAWGLFWGAATTLARLLFGTEFFEGLGVSYPLALRSQVLGGVAAGLSYGVLRRAVKSVVSARVLGIPVATVWVWTIWWSYNGFADLPPLLLIVLVFGIPLGVFFGGAIWHEFGDGPFDDSVQR